MISYIKDIFSNRKTDKNKDELNNLNTFIRLIGSYLKREHPNIKFNYSICKTMEDEADLKIFKTVIIRDIINQFINFEYIKNTQKEVKKELLWSEYSINSLSKKRPIDFLRRKELIYLRDKQKCDRCGNSIEKLNQSFTTFIKEIEQGGSYSIENLALVCFNCNQVLQNMDKDSYNLALPLRDELYNLIN